MKEKYTFKFPLFATDEACRSIVPPPLTQWACCMGGGCIVATADDAADGMCCVCEGMTDGCWPWTGTKPGMANGTSNMELLAGFEAIGWMDVDAICLMGVADGCAIAETVGVGRAWTVNGCVDALVQRHDGSEWLADAAAIEATGMTDPEAAAADTMGYGVCVDRACPAILGFGTFGVQTAHGNSPTKRSPTGLASGCAWDVIFNATLFGGTKLGDATLCWRTKWRRWERKVRRTICFISIDFQYCMLHYVLKAINFSAIWFDLHSAFEVFTFHNSMLTLFWNERAEFSLLKVKQNESRDSLLMKYAQNFNGHHAQRSQLINSSVQSPNWKTVHK